jgi:hypothetical protein
MSTKEILKFNSLLEELLEKLITKFQNDKLKSYRRFFLMMKNVQPKMPANLFMSGCINYRNEIKSRDENFFITSSDIKEKSKYFGNFTEDCGIESYWSELSIQTKNAIWDYIQTLFVLGEIIINKNQELFKKYNNMYLSEYKNDIISINNSEDLLKKLNS